MGNPRGFLDFKRENLAKRAPKERIKDYKEFVSLPSEQSVQIQASRCMNCGVPFCQVGIISAGKEIGCPLKNLIPEFNDALYKGSWQEAYERLSLTNPFPEFTGRVCPAPCEDSCVCAINSGSVSIKANEFAIIENAFKSGFVKGEKAKKQNGKKVAIIGSGPAALACAWALNLRGFKVSVFERDERVGGLLMFGIPDMKLEKSVIERRVKLLEQSGVEFKTNQNIDSKAKADKLIKEFDAVVLAVGASKPIDLKLKGRDNQNIMFAVDFLRANTRHLLEKGKGGELAKGKNVLVIGSGDTSVDCVAVAIRQGAKSITRFERSPKRPLNRAENNPWPLKADIFSTDYGLEEAICAYGKDIRQYQKLTKGFVEQNGKLVGVIASDLKREFKDSKPINVEIKGSEKEYKADLVLLAMGFEGCENEVGANFGVEFDEKHNILTKNYLAKRSLTKACADKSSCKGEVALSCKGENSSYKGLGAQIYACGDARMGQSLVVWAIKDGIECAKAITKDFEI